MQFEILSLLYGVVVPAIAAAAVALVPALLNQRKPHDFRFERSDLLSASCGALAVLAGFGSAWLLFDWAHLWLDWSQPHDFWQRQIWITAAAAFGSAFVGWRRGPAGWRILVCAAIALGGGWLIVPDGEGWTDLAPFRAALIGLNAVGTFFVWTLIDRGSRRPQRLPLWWFSAAAAVSALVVFQSGNAKLGQLTGALCAALCGAAAICTWRPSAHVVRGAAGPLVLTLAGLTMSGYFNTYSEIPRASFLLAMLAPAGVTAGDWLLPRARGWQRSLVSGAVVLLALAVAASLALGFSDGADEW